jgi:hypothetical protein
MAFARIRDDLGRIATSAAELIDGALTYERALDEYFQALLAAHQGDPTRIWSIDGVHLDYLDAAR